MGGICTKPDQAIAITVLEDKNLSLSRALEKKKEVVILSDTTTSEIQPVEPVV